MPLTRERFTVLLNPLNPETEEPAEHLVTITHQDMMRGEQALIDSGSSDKAKLALVTAWCWAALMRTGVYANSWARFRDFDCGGLEDAPEAEVDPTQQETTGDSA